MIIITSLFSQQQQVHTISPVLKYIVSVDMHHKVGEHVIVVIHIDAVLTVTTGTEDGVHITH